MIFQYFCKLFVPRSEGPSLTLPNDKILDYSELKEFADDNFKFDQMEETSLNGLKTLWEKEKLLVTSNFSFFLRVFKRLVLQTRENQGLFWKGLILYQTTQF